MKARYLKSILGTKRPVCDDGEKMCVGSRMVHDLLSVDKKTLRIRYALGYPGKGRDSIHDEEILGLWDKLQAVVDSGEMRAIIDENDVLENPIPVFTYDHDFNIVESTTDALGYPNVTHDGKLMHDNTYFPDIDTARRAALREAQASYESISEWIQEQSEKQAKRQERLSVVSGAILDLATKLKEGE